MTIESTTVASPALLSRIIDRAFAQTMAMIYLANHRPDARKGDPKVGGHPASCASSMHLLGALHLYAREPEDFVCCKPHASPVDHTLHHLMQLFRREQDDHFYGVDESKAIMGRLRKMARPGEEPVLQSYHARSDPDSFHFLPSGSVGIPPVVSVYLALAHRYARDHGYDVAPKAHFWSMMGDSEFREGSLLECLPDVAERQLGTVTWIIDYNRQNLDGTRIPNERSLHGQDCDRIQRTAEANGWRVIQLRHGAFRQSLFPRQGGEAFRRLFEGGITEYEYQLLLFKNDAEQIRRRCAEKEPACEVLLERLSDAELLRAFADVGGHCVQCLMRAYDQAHADPDAPLMIIAHTIKGWGLEMRAHPANHSMLPSREEVDRLLERTGLTPDDPFALFEPGSEEAAFLGERRDAFRAGILEAGAMRARNRAAIRKAIEADGGIPDSLGIDLSMFPWAHTQWMWGQMAAKLVRIGVQDEGGPETALGHNELTADEKRWKTTADFCLTLSPDVGTSTNISPAMDQRTYGPDYQPDLEGELELDYKHPELFTTDDPWTRHIRFEIAEANCMSAVGAFGKMIHHTGLPFFPMMTVYDFFIKRALDQLYYNLYWGAEFVLVGTPSGVTLSSEGAQHSWKSDIQIPNLITWEPMFAVEMDWILSDALRRHMMDENEGRRGVLIRGVTRAIRQGLLLEWVRRQAASKEPAALAGGARLKPAGAGPDWGDALDESTLPALPDDALLARVREHCLAGAWYLVDWRGYAGYEPGENVVQILSMGSVTTEAIAASEALLERGVFANVIVVSSPELLLGLLGGKDGYRHLRETLAVSGDLFAVRGAGESRAGLLSLAGRRVPIVALCDGEPGLLDNAGSIVGVKQVTLGVRRFSKCGRPDEVFRYQGLDAESLVEACGRALAETALEDLVVSRELLERFAANGTAPPARRGSWRELWPEADRR
jgi:pyruvate dehydrogenase E1 component